MRLQPLHSLHSQVLRLLSKRLRYFVPLLMKYGEGIGLTNRYYFNKVARPLYFYF